MTRLIVLLCSIFLLSCSNNITKNAEDSISNDIVHDTEDSVSNADINTQSLRDILQQNCNNQSLILSDMVSFEAGIQSVKKKINGNYAYRSGKTSVKGESFAILYAVEDGYYSCISELLINKPDIHGEYLSEKQTILVDFLSDAIAISKGESNFSEKKSAIRDLKNETIKYIKSKDWYNAKASPKYDEKTIKNIYPKAQNYNLSRTLSHKVNLTVLNIAGLNSCYKNSTELQHELNGDLLRSLSLANKFYRSYLSGFYSLGRVTKMQIELLSLAINNSAQGIGLDGSSNSDRCGETDD